MPFGIGFQEMVIFFGIAVLLFGAKKIPELARGIGSSITEFKRGIMGVEKEVKDIANELKK